MIIVISEKIFPLLRLVRGERRITMTDFIVEFKNGGILDIKADATYIHGSCPTCEIGAERINHIEIITTKYIITINACDQYSYVFGDEDVRGNPPVLTVADIIEIFDIENAADVTEEDFVGAAVTKTAYLADYGDININIKTNGEFNYGY